MDVKNIVTVLLIKYPETRDHDGILAEKFFQEFYNGNQNDFIRSNIQETIIRQRRLVQSQHIELQGNNHQKRQLHARTMASKLRNREKPEDLSSMFEPIEHLKKKSIFSFIRNIF